MAQNNQRRFIRVRGRVIPIGQRKDSPRKRGVIGLGLAATGVGIGAAAGRLEAVTRVFEGRFRTKALKYEIKSQGIWARSSKMFSPKGSQLNLFDQLPNLRRIKARSKSLQALKAGERYSSAAKVLTSLRGNLHPAGKLAGGALIAAGISYGLKSKKDSRTEEIIKNVGATLAAGAIVVGSGKYNLRGKAWQVIKALKK